MNLTFVRVVAGLTFLILSVFQTARVQAQVACPVRPSVEEEAKTLASSWFRRGTRLFEAREHKKALDVFICTYRILPNQLTRYLIGRSAEGAGMYRVAVSVYKELLGNPPKTVKVLELQKRIAKLKKKIQAATRAVPSLAPRRPARPPRKPKIVVPKPEPKPEGPAAKPHVDTSRIKKAAWATMIVAMAATATGVALGGLLAWDKKKIEDAPDGARWHPSLDERHSRMERTNVSMGVCLGVGLAAAVASVVLFVVRSKREKETTVGLMPTKGGTMAAVGGRF